MSSRATVWPSCSTWNRPVSVNVPSTVASTSRRAARARNASTCCGGTARVMRSCDSDSKISQGSSPGYLSGARSRCNSQPLLNCAISPTEDDKPPAPLSVMQVYNCKSRASSRKSNIFFCVMGSPIWTADEGDTSLSSTEENVAP
jgi:hypothetical protein